MRVAPEIIPPSGHRLPLKKWREATMTHDDKRNGVHAKCHAKPG